MLNLVKVAILVLVITLIPQLAIPHQSLVNLKVTQKKSHLKPNLKLLKQIQKNQPKIDLSYAKYLAVTIERISKKYRIKPAKVVAIAMQESSYTLDAKNCYMVKGKMRCDYCMMQINDKTIEAFGFDHKKLMTDVEYCVEAGVRVLNDFRRMYGQSEEDFWTRYNSSNPEKRLIYGQKVARFF